MDGPELVPGPKVQTDAEILAFIKTSVGPSHHAVGTCRMGRADDSGAVVDMRGRVLGGVEGLRVVDSSVFALLPPGQPQATVCEYCLCTYNENASLTFGRHACGEVGGGYPWTIITSTW